MAIQGDRQALTAAEELERARARLVQKSKLITQGALDSVAKYNDSAKFASSQARALQSQAGTRFNELGAMQKSASELTSGMNNPNDLEDGASFNMVGDNFDVAGDALKVPFGLIEDLQTVGGDIFGTRSGVDRAKARAYIDSFNTMTGSDVRPREYDTGNALVDWMRETNRSETAKLARPLVQIQSAKDEQRRRAEYLASAAQSYKDSSLAAGSARTQELAGIKAGPEIIQEAGDGYKQLALAGKYGSEAAKAAVEAEQAKAKHIPTKEEAAERYALGTQKIILENAGQEIRNKFDETGNPLRLKGLGYDNAAKKAQNDFGLVFDPLRLEGLELDNQGKRAGLNFDLKANPLRLEGLNLANEATQLDNDFAFDSYGDRLDVLQGNSENLRLTNDFLSETYGDRALGLRLDNEGKELRNEDQAATNAFNADANPVRLNQLHADLDSTRTSRLIGIENYVMDSKIDAEQLIKIREENRALLANAKNSQQQSAYQTEILRVDLALKNQEYARNVLEGEINTQEDLLADAQRARLREDLELRRLENDVASMPSPESSARLRDLQMDKAIYDNALAQVQIKQANKTLTREEASNNFLALNTLRALMADEMWIDADAGGKKLLLRNSGLAESGILDGLSWDDTPNYWGGSYENELEATSGQTSSVSRLPQSPRAYENEMIDAGYDPGAKYTLQEMRALRKRKPELKAAINNYIIANPEWYPEAAAILANAAGGNK
jgi:hypothetical protein